MSSLTPQDPWLAENSSVDDIGVVELFLKSLDPSGSSVGDHCWTGSLADNTSADANFVPPVTCGKFGYEPFSLPTLGTIEIKQEPLEESCFIDQSSEKLNSNPFLNSLPSVQKFSDFRYSSQFEGFSEQPSADLELNCENWLSSPSSCLTNFDSLKVVPELLVERIIGEENSPTNSGNLSLQPPIHQVKLEQVPTSYLCNNNSCKIEASSAPQCSQQLPKHFYPDTQLPRNLAQTISQQSLGLGNVVVKQEPSEDNMSLNGHFMCHTMFMMNNTAPKCGCDLSKTSHGSHFLCTNNKPAMSVEQYEELLKRGSAALLGEPQTKIFPPHQSIRSDKERPFSCDECGKSFLLKHHLVTHSRVHTGVRPYGCSDCGKTFAHKHCLVTHQRLHSGLRPFQCLECKKSFTLKHHLVTHSRTHSKDRPFHCEECGRTFSQKRNLVTHAKLHSGERPFQCGVCGECFSQREHLLAHSRFHGGESAFVCADCGEAFARKFQLVDHRRQHGHSPFSCSICGKEFLQKRTLIAHTKLHEGNRSYSCKHCSQTFPRMSDLIAHSRIHTNFTCKDCNCSFPTHEGLVLHLQHHGQAGTLGEPRSTSSNPPSKPYTCPECGTGFAQKHGMVQHMNRKHSNNITTPSNVNSNRQNNDDKNPSNITINPIDNKNTMMLAQSCDIMEQIKHQVLSEQIKAKIQ